MNLHIEIYRNFVRQQSLKLILVNEVILRCLGNHYPHKTKKKLMIKNIFRTVSTQQLLILYLNLGENRLIIF